MTNDKDTILSRLDFVTFYETECGGQLRGRGENRLTCSPFREDQNPSFSVNIETGLFNDFGDNNARGDAITFVEKKYGFDFPQALEYLAKYTGDIARPVAQRKPIEARNEQPEAFTPPEQFDTVALAYNGFNTQRKFKKVSSILEIDAYGKPGFADCGVTLHKQLPEIETYAQEHGGSLSGYKNPCYTPLLPFDIDCKENLADAQLSTMMLYERLCDKYGVDCDDILLWFSGRAGFHLLVKNKKIESIGGRLDIPAILEKMCSQIAGDIPGFDIKIYDTGTRLFRIPNTINAKSGLYKIPILAGELYTLSIIDIQKLARSQRTLEMASKEWLTKWPKT